MKFAEFEIDVAAGELRRDGARVKIQDLPLRVLILLRSRAGEVVSREQLRTELWSAETFVDAEAGLNTAIAKLREALGDSADAPRFIHTLPRRGYRFVDPTPIEPVESADQATTPVDDRVAVVGTTPGRGPRTIRRGVAVAIVAALVLLAFGAARTWMKPPPVTIAVVLFHNETGDSTLDRLAQQLTDATVVALAGLPRYAVIGNAAVLRTPRIFADIQKIGQTLRADYLVLGQLQDTGESLIVRAHFIRVADQKHLWAQGIRGTPAEFDTRVPAAIVDAVNRTTGGSPRPD